MECSSRAVIIVTIKLTNEEAVWLKSIMQNELHPNESARDRSMRERFWDELLRIGVGVRTEEEGS